MNEYQDQDTWFNLYGYDGFMWEYIADFDSREEAEEYADKGDIMSVYENYRIERERGLR